MMRELSEAEFLQTMLTSMRDVMADPGEAIDIWPYVEAITGEVGVLEVVIENHWVEHVYRNEDESFDHVLVPMGRKDVFLAVIVDRTQWNVRGYYVLNLRDKYRIWAIDSEANF